MGSLIPSFLAGILTILAPCVLSLLPIILGGSLTEKNPERPLIIAVSLGVSIFIFTLLLKATTVFFIIPEMFWQTVSGIMISLFGITMVFPQIWEKISFKLGLFKSENFLSEATKKEGLWGPILLGAALGPVFNTCSPTYLLILAIVLPSNFALGMAHLAIYIFGLMLMLLVIGYGGRAIVQKFKFAANPNGWLKRGLGILMIFTGLTIITGFNKTIETKILDAGYNGPINIENSLMEKF